MPVAVPSGTPLSARHTIVNATSLVLRWSAPSINSQNGVIRHYSLQFNNTDGLWTLTQTSYTATNLHPYYIYAYRVAAFTVGLGPYSLLRTVRMPQSGTVYTCYHIL